MNFLFLTFGPTHSGKTTFAKKFMAALGPSAKCIRVDNDAVDEFIKENYGNPRLDPAILATRTPSNPDLRLLIPQLIADYALKEDYSVIATAAHPKRVIREKYYDIARAHQAKIILLMFRIDDDLALERIRSTNRNTDLLFDTTSFEELLQKQKANIEEPTDDEKQNCYKVYEIRLDNADRVLEKIVKLYKTNR